MKRGDYFEDVNKFPVNDLIGYDVRSIEPLFRQVAWPVFEQAIRDVVSEGVADYVLPEAARVEIYTERMVHEERLEKAANKERVRRLQVGFPLPP